MKNKLFFLFLFLISLYTLAIVRANSLPLFGKVIYIDPGHGGPDPGAVWNGIYESDINLEISLEIEKELEKNGAIVYLTRYGDYDLSANYAELRKRSDLSRRANIINRSNADIYLSIHLNSDVSTTWKGAQVFYNTINEKNEQIAKIMQEQLGKDLNSKRKYKKLNDHYLYNRVKIPGVLIEVGFISNPNERYLLRQKDYQKKVALSIKDGLVSYFTQN